MAPTQRTRWLIAGFALCAAPCTSAQQLCVAPEALLPADRILPDGLGETPQTSDGEDVLEITYSGSARANASRTTLTDNVVVRLRDTTFEAERADLNSDDDTLEFVGSVRLTNPQFTVFGEDAFVDSVEGIARFGPAGFELPQRPARGTVSAIVIDEVERTLSVENATFTTCPIEQPAWLLDAREITLDIEEGLGTARGMKLKFRGVPILYAPYFTFPLNDERKSGFLTPDIADRDRTGLYIAAPYYFNIAPNYDLVIEPRYMSKRGVQLANDFRYLMPGTEGALTFEYLPDDDETQSDRRYVNLQQETLFAEGWEIIVDMQQVSDEAYFEDLGTNLSTTSQTHLNRYIGIGFHAEDWSIMTRLQNYQTIDMLIDDQDRPYERMPQVVFDGGIDKGILAFDSEVELVNFHRNVGTTGWRFDSTQEASIRLARPGMYMTPAVALRQTSYWLDDSAPASDDRLRRSLPVSSLDMGMLFERGAGTSEKFTQTLEPRMLLVSVPYEDQNALPVFDTITPDFNLVQLFRKYQFVGPDRISDSDLLSFGITTRLLDANTGRERFAATVGQTRYQDTQRVALPGEAPNVTDASDYIAEVSVSLRNAWNLDVGYQWNDETDRTARAETRLEFRPRDDRLFGFGYRYRRGLLEQGDLSIVWPITQRWRFIGRYSYSLLEEEPLDQFVGWEYEACCWRLRMVGRQYVSRTTGEKDSSISLQFELKGLSRSASSPEELLDRGILGYRSLSRSTVQ